MLDGYFDDAGTLSDPQSKSLVVAGFVARPDKWQVLKDAWTPILQRHKILYFSGKECEHGTGEFDKRGSPQWARPASRNAVRMELVSVIIEAGLPGFVSAVILADYKAIHEAERRRIGKPFSLPHKHC